MSKFVKQASFAKNELTIFPKALVCCPYIQNLVVNESKASILN